jgi:RimJ/RimL family protein N-acetyltransferase
VTVTLAVQPTSSAPALVLRPWTRGDLPALVAAHADPVMRRFLIGTVDDADAAQRWIDAQEVGWTDGSRHSFAVLEVDEEVELAGMVVVKRSAADDAVAEVGYWTCAHARGRGIASRSLVVVATWVFDTSASIQRLDLFHAVENEASCRVALKAGFGLQEVVPPWPPAFPQPGHLHVRKR